MATVYEGESDDAGRSVAAQIRDGELVLRTDAQVAGSARMAVLGSHLYVGWQAGHAPDPAAVGACDWYQEVELVQIAGVLTVADGSQLVTGLIRGCGGWTTAEDEGDFTMDVEPGSCRLEPVHANGYNEVYGEPLDIVARDGLWVELEVPPAPAFAGATDEEIEILQDLDEELRVLDEQTQDLVEEWFRSRGE